MRWHNFLRQLLRQEVIDATRSWFANLTAIVGTIFAATITGLMYWGAWSAETESLRLGFLFTALVLTHIEVMMGIAYLHRLAMKSIELNAGSVELDIQTEQTAAKITGTVQEVKEVAKEVQKDA